MDIDITESLKNKEKSEKLEEEAKKQAEETLEENKELHTSSDSKNVLLMVGVIIGLFIIVIGGFSWYNTITGGAVATIDDLHQMNYDGDLKEEQGYVYNGYSVVRNDKLWWTQVTGVDEDLIIPDTRGLLGIMLGAEQGGEKK